MVPMSHQHFTHNHVWGALKPMHIAEGYNLSVADTKRLAREAPFQFASNYVSPIPLESRGLHGTMVNLL